eukprot:CAMPEP_0171532118 /NCGR_PEP_ID=MMETSP0959-20130129/14565_1 /TAXON_ID=87120 /ORGANISM="Aurantiochytrium limacinum, Strain ATCCMYA-1381" /LENGTH=426 /DNA_ID=CAMNT_0012076205 /DNA_START=445 /DNA_END=1725 /DNA_ORIENTATION=-
MDVNQFILDRLLQNGMPGIHLPPASSLQLQQQTPSAQSLRQHEHHELEQRRRQQVEQQKRQRLQQIILQIMSHQQEKRRKQESPRQGNESPTPLSAAAQALLEVLSAARQNSGSSSSSSSCSSPTPGHLKQETPVARANSHWSSEHEAAQKHLSILDHTSTCENDKCAVEGCSQMKALISHCWHCEQESSCTVCRRFHGLLALHSSRCNRLLGTCFVPCCLQFKLLSATTPQTNFLSQNQSQLYQLQQQLMQQCQQQQQQQQQQPQSCNQTPLRKPPHPLLPHSSPHSSCPSQRLVLLQHAGSCSAAPGTCKVCPHCDVMKRNLEHVSACENMTCGVEFCALSKYALHHFYECKASTCQVCDPVRNSRLVESHMRTCISCLTSRSMTKSSLPSINESRATMMEESDEIISTRIAADALSALASSSS